MAIFMVIFIRWVIEMIKNENCDVSSCGGTPQTYGPVLWHPPWRSEGACGPIIAESGESPWLHPGSRGRDAPQLEDSLVAEYLLYPSRKGQSAVYSVWLEGRWPVLLPCVPLQILKKTWLHQNLVILIRLTNLIGTRGSSDKLKSTSDDLEDKSNVK